jgi:hypothetical protein
LGHHGGKQAAERLDELAALLEIDQPGADSRSGDRDLLGSLAFIHRLQSGVVEPDFATGLIEHNQTEPDPAGRLHPEQNLRLLPPILTGRRLA